MCDMTEFVMCVAITMTEASYPARMFMEHILLKFGLFIMVVCDDDNDFIDTFKKMCVALNIRFHIVAKRNHKAVGIEKFHKFLNHVKNQQKNVGRPNHLWR